MGRDVAIAELDDDHDKVYLFGMNIQDVEQQHEMQRAIDDLFTRAGAMLVNLPMDTASGIEVYEADEEDLQELLDYRDVMEGLDG